MKTLGLILCVACLASAGLGQQSPAGREGRLAHQPATVPNVILPPPTTAVDGGAPGRSADPMTVLSQSVKADLDKSNAQLNQLRQQIEQERMPLAKELTTLEDTLGQLRREHETVARQVDSGSLETTTLKAEIKARQDELAYIGNLLDEYAKTFEAKVNVCELQYCGEAVQAAKDAPTNASLSPMEKFTKQLVLATLSVKRLSDAIGGMRFPGIGVNMQGQVVDGQFALVGPVALFRSKNGEVSGVVVPQSGSTRPLIRPLEGELQAAIGSLVEKGEGLMPLDPSRGAALKALVQKTSLIHIFKKGGPIMWPLLTASVLALGTILNRVLFLLGQKLRRDPKALDALLAAVGEGDLERAVRESSTSKFYIVRALNYALRHRAKSLSSALEYAQAQELKRFRRGIPVLGTVITLAPLLGLLGTVTGMMGSFSIMGGDLGGSGAITGGVAESLIATAFGLGIAISSLIPFNMLNARVVEARHELEAAASQLNLLVRPAAAPATARPASYEPAAHPTPGPRQTRTWNF